MCDHRYLGFGSLAGARIGLRAAGVDEGQRDHGGAGQDADGEPDGVGVAVHHALELDQLLLRLGAAAAAMWSVTYAVVAEAAMVFSSAVPIAPPTCCEVLTIAEATPASRGSTPVRGQATWPA